MLFVSVLLYCKPDWSHICVTLFCALSYLHCPRNVIAHKHESTYSLNVSQVCCLSSADTMNGCRTYWHENFFFFWQLMDGMYLERCCSNTRKDVQVCKYRSGTRDCWKWLKKTPLLFKASIRKLLENYQ